MSQVHDTIGDTLSDFGGYLRCEVCHDIRPIGHVAFHMAGGWPKCCGYTMRWWTQRQIDAGESPTYREAFTARSGGANHA